jgi:hypothetical protein
MGAVFPITMSLATSNGWGQPLAVFLFVLVVELITNNVIEPLLYGHMIGVSPTALLVSAACWFYLWGPVGLILSAPFAVCLVVLGKNISQLNFLYVLLGDKPALDMDCSYYQRLMLGDSLEAASIVLKRRKEAEPDTVYDDLIVPAMSFTKRDYQRRYLTDEDRLEVVEGIQLSLKAIQESLPPDSHPVERESQSDENDSSRNKTAIPFLCCPAADEMDCLFLEMLGQIIDTDLWQMETVSLEILTSELVDKIQVERPGLFLIASTAPGDLAQARYLCKRLRKAIPDLQIIVARCGTKQRRLEVEQLKLAGATFVTTTLLDTRQLLHNRHSLVEAHAARLNTASAALSTASA